MLAKYGFVFLVLSFFCFSLVSAVMPSPTIVTQGEWVLTKNTETGYIPIIFDKNKKITDFCIGSLTATKLNNIPKDYDFSLTDDLTSSSKIARKQIKATDSKLEKNYFGYCYTTKEKDKKIKFGKNSIEYEWIERTLEVYDTPIFDYEGYNITVEYKGTPLDVQVKWIIVQGQLKIFFPNLTGITLPLDEITFVSHGHPFEFTECKGDLVTECDYHNVLWDGFRAKNNITSETTIQTYDTNGTTWNGFIDWFRGVFGYEPLQEQYFLNEKKTFKGSLVDLDPQIITQSWTTSTALLNQSVGEGNSYFHVEINDTSERYATFDGTNDYVGVTSIPSLSSDMTLSFWVNSVGKTNADFNRLIELPAGASAGVNIYHYNATVVLDNSGGPTAGIYNVSTPKVNTTWRHVVVTRTSTTYKLYVDGVSYGTDTGTVVAYTKANIGSNRVHNSFFNGSIDEVQIFNRVLSTDEITNIYNLNRTDYNGSTTGLVGYWTFDNRPNNGDDSSGWGNTGTFTNGAYSTIDTSNSAYLNNDPYSSLVAYYPFDSDNYLNNWGVGQVNESLRFDGTNDYIETVSTTTTVSTMTVMGWIKRKSYSSSTNLATLISPTTVTAGPTITTGNGTANSKRIQIFLTASTYLESDNDIINSTDTWYHIAVTTSNTSTNGVLVYVNGQLEPMTIKTAGTFTSASTTWRLGRFGSTFSHYLNGSADNVRVWNRNLSSTEITNIYSNESLGINDPNMNTTSLIAEYKFDNIYSAGLEAEDTSGNSRHGVLTNFGVTTSYDMSNNNLDGTYTSGAYNGFSNSLYGASAKFNAVIDYIKIPDNSLFSFGNTTPSSMENPLTFNVWTYIVQNATTQAILGKGDATSSWEYGLYYRSTNQIAIDFFTAGDNNRYIGRQTDPTTSIQNSWHMITVVYNGNKTMSGIDIYIDGQIADTQDYKGSSASSYNGMIDGTSAFQIGKRASIYFNGSIDEVMIFKTNLSAQQVLDIYNNQSKRFKDNGTITLLQQTLNQTASGVFYNLSQYGLNQELLNTDIQARAGYWDVTKGYNTSDSELIAYWTGDGNTNDLLGRYNGTNVGTGNTSVAGVYNNSFSASGGTGNYVNVSNPTALNVTQGTVSFWVKSTSDTAQYLISFGDNSTPNLNGAIWIGNGVTGTLTNELVGFSHYRHGASLTIGAYTTATRTELFDNNWHHIVFTADNVANKLYLDGVSRTISFSSNTNIGEFFNQSNFNNIKIGSSLSGAAALNGSLDDVMMWNRSLTPSEVKDLYIKGRANWQYTDWQDLNSTGATIFDFQQNSTNFLPEYKLFANTSQGNQTFYTPQLNLNNQIFTFDYITTAITNTCANFISTGLLECSDFCNLTSNFIVSAINLIFNGSGNILIQGNITNVTNMELRNGCIVTQSGGSYFGK